MKPIVPERLLPGQGDWHFSGHQHLQRYAFAAGFVPGLDVLDWACGVGYGSHVLAHSGARRVLGGDLSEEALGYAGNHYSSPNLAYARADALAGPPEAGAFDFVVSFETIEHLAQPARFVANIADSLRPSGRLLISAPNALLHSRHPDSPIQNDHHVSEPTYKELVAWLEPRFRVVRAWEQSPYSDHFAVSAAVTALDRCQRGNYAWCRALNFIEDSLRRLVGKSLPEPSPITGSWPARWAEIVPLLPERQLQAHTYLLLCERQ